MLTKGHRAFNFSANAPPQPLSGPLSHNRTGLLSFQSKCHNLCVRILDLFGQALDIEPTWFGERHDQSKGETGSILRLLYYPSLHRLAHEQEQRRGEKVEVFDDGVDVRAGAHSDYGSVTLLFQQKGQPGLEIFTREGTWEGVPVDPVVSIFVIILLPFRLFNFPYVVYLRWVIEMGLTSANRGPVPFQSW